MILAVTNFTWLDATVVVGYLAMLVFIGVYFSRRQSNLEEYFLASRTMGWLPIGMSLMAALNSGIDYVMQPSSIIIYGLIFIVGVLSWFFLYPWAAYVTIPFYRRLNVLSAYEYLETRFDGKVRTLIALLFLAWRIGWMGTAIYVPALVLSEISGGMFKPWQVVLVLGFVVTVYTMLGGIKAVIWTEVIQFCVMLCGLAIMVGVVIYKVPDGISGIWHIASEGGKTAMAYRIPGFGEAGLWDKIRMFFAEPKTVVGLLIACVVGRMNTYTGDQVMIQRFQTTKSVKDSRQGFIINALGDSVWTIGLSFVGLGLYAFYIINPKPAELVTQPDHTVPYFLRTMFPTGVLGLVLAATLAASLSSIASAINSCTTVAMVDFYERLIKRKKHVPAGPEPRSGATLEYEAKREASETRRAEGGAEAREDVMLSRIVTICFGIVGVVIASSVGSLGNIIEIAQKVIQTYTGPMFGIYLLGMFTRRANSAGALVGGILGTAAGIYIAFFFKDPSGKDYISFLWPTVFGFVITFAVGWLVSLVLGEPVSDKAKQLTWWHVMQRPLPEADTAFNNPAKEVRPAQAVEVG
jgi:sodium-coupled monocarboxylate transporter 8/12